MNINAGKKIKISCAIILFVVIMGVSGCTRVSVTDGNIDGANLGNIIEFGDIQWRILDVQDGKKLLLSEYVLEFRPFHDTWDSISWSDSSIRQYLNTVFYYENFTEDERSRIAETNVVTLDNPWYGSLDDIITADKIFLLSIEEVVWFFGDSGHLDNPIYEWGIDDQYNSNRIAYYLDGTVAIQWWLRSPGEYLEDVVAIDFDGLVSLWGNRINWEGGGVRPAMWLFQ